MNQQKKYLSVVATDAAHSRASVGEGAGYAGAYLLQKCQR